MGWYGDYQNSGEVIKEKLSYANKKELLILGTKHTKSWGAILYQTSEKTVDIDFFIFKDTMYKPLSWSDRPNLIPKVWISAVLPHANDYEKQQYNDYLDNKNKEKDAPKLDDILVVGKKYKVWNEHIATYMFKQKRSFIFKLDNGSLTRFTNLKPSGITEIN